MKVNCNTLPAAALIIATSAFTLLLIFIYFTKYRTSLDEKNLIQIAATVQLPPYNCTGLTAVHKGCQGLKMVTRSEWLAQPSRRKLSDLVTPARNLLLSDTNSKECRNEECMLQVRHIQFRDIEQSKLDDILYNFLIGGDGTIFEGRGYFKQTEGSENSFLLGLIGNFTATSPSKEQIDAIRMFADHSMSW